MSSTEGALRTEIRACAVYQPSLCLDECKATDWPTWNDKHSRPMGESVQSFGFERNGQEGGEREKQRGNQDLG